MLTYGLDAFGVNDVNALNNDLAALITKHYPQEARRQLGAMMLADTIDKFAQKVDALEGGRSTGYLIHPGIEADTLDALFAHGMTRQVKLVDGKLRRAD